MLSRAALSILPLALAAPAAAQTNVAEQRAFFGQPVEPFTIAGNVHYVGTAHVSAFLITGDAGHVLIDGTMDASAAQVAANIERLGFRLRDVRVLLVNHAHWDHAGGLAELKRLTGARLVASAGDAGDLMRGANADRDDLAGFPPVSVDRHVEDGDTLRLGGIVLTAHLTPGHTRGCTTWTMRTEQGGRGLDVMFACSLTVAGQRLVGNDRYPEIVRDFEASFAALRAIPADIYLGFHDGSFDFDARRRRLLAGDRLAFVDPALAPARIDRAERDFRGEHAEQQAAAGGQAEGD